VAKADGRAAWDRGDDTEHPDLELLAACADRTLTRSETAQIERHAAGCPECADLLADARAFLEGDGASVNLIPPPPGSWRRRLLAPGAAALSAAALVAAIVHTATAPGPRRVEPGLAMRANPADLAGLGMALLARGEASRAIPALERAAAMVPGDAAVQSHLAAAYIERARQGDSDAASDYARAVTAAERALGAAAPPPGAWFNRALALDGMGAGLRATQAWHDFATATAGTYVVVGPATED
jgi:tetratricopeptide (TPR) repeat protein